MVDVVNSAAQDSLPRDALSRGCERPEVLTELPPDTAPWFTVVIPTRNEEGSIRPLLERLRTGLGDAVVEILFVDDSADETPEVIRAAARASGLAVRLLHRSAGNREGGLSGAVIAGLRNAHGSWAVVMDGDLQHPPELVARMVAIGQARKLDLVAGSRYVGDGGNEGLADGYRKAVSGIATKGTKALFPRRLAQLSDPMSGFFAVRLAAVDLNRLDPIGFKILLEIAVRQPRLKIAQVPFVFGDRVAGESKASGKEGMRFLRHVLRLRFFVLKRQVARSSAQNRAVRLRRFALFGVVGVSGIAVNTVALWLLSIVGNVHYLLAAVLATVASTTWNFALTEAVVFRGEKPGSVFGRGVKFYLVNYVALLIRLPLLALLVSGLSIPLLIANLITLTLLFAARFVILDSAIYSPKDPADLDREPMRIVVNATEAQLVAPKLSPTHRPGQRYLPYRYSVDGIATIGSQVPLRELEYFRAQWVGNTTDITIRVGQVGRNGLRSRAMVTQNMNPPSVQYQEHLGRLGANFRVDIGDRVTVVVSPALAKSPHVVYTNVIEALLRFLAVSRGRILLHSACLEINGTGVLLSAKTDTGKTGTVLRLLREHGALFLSDDMTIVDGSGNATCFPKPLTISHHTLRAVQAGDLTSGEWRKLRLQSRLHSKEGREFGLLLARLNIPIMGFNSLTQRIVPPPKYNVDRLVDCLVHRRTTIENLFVIERGPTGLREVGDSEALETMVANTDDAYGFPPFRQMAPSIIIGTDDYDELRRKERAIMSSALANFRVRGLSCDDFSWADRIVDLLNPSSIAVA